MLRSAAGKALLVAKGMALFWGAVMTLALMFGVASVALGANGDNFALGRNNLATALTKLTANTNGSAMQLQNTNSGDNDTALNLNVQAGEAPMKVNSGAKVANLEADELDGKSANQLLRVASLTTEATALEDGTNGTLASTQITAPAKGFLVIDAGSEFFNNSQNDFVKCSIEVDDSLASGSSRIINLNGASRVNQEENCSTNSVVPVAAGTHSVDLEVDLVSSGATTYGSTALSAIYVPFGGTGTPPPSSAALKGQEK